MQQNIKGIKKRKLSFTQTNKQSKVSFFGGEMIRKRGEVLVMISRRCRLSYYYFF
jgi:hypothetical protein